MGREVVQLHYRADLDPEMDYDHNSDEREAAISKNITKLINESLFHQGPLDSNVSFLFIIISPFNAL